MDEIFAWALIVTDHSFLSRGIAAVLSDAKFEWSKKAADAPSALRICEELRPAFVVVDLDARNYSGLSLVRDLSRLHPAGRVVGISEQEEISSVHRAFAAGIAAYISKRDSDTELASALSQLYLGKLRFVGTQIRERLMSSLGAPEKHGTPNELKSLSPREREVFQITAKNPRSLEVAKHLGVSLKTVETHYHRIKIKLGLRSHAELRRTAESWCLETI